MSDLATEKIRTGRTMVLSHAIQALQVQYVLNNPKFTTPVYSKSIFLFQMIIYAMKRKSAAITSPTAVEPTMTLEAPLPPPAEEEDDGERVTDGFTPAPGDAAEMTSLALAEPEAVAEAALPETTLEVAFTELSTWAT